MKLTQFACATAFLALSGAIAAAQSVQDQPLDEPMAEDQAADEATDEGEQLGPDEEAAPQQPSFNKQDTATLRALDKITGRSTDFEIKVGAPVVYGSLKIDLEVCFQTPPEEPPESAAFLQIETTDAIRMKSMTVPRLASNVEGVSDAEIDAEAIAAREENEDAGKDEKLLFSGWMFSSSPGLSALEHPVYDVWVIRCTERSPVSPSGPDAPAQ
ncbi:DUF2155 domain-containing protein [Henriciella sp.]|uniref:DUF2155 domain-containing protein n=1 Tax=Henriciella sp. TaxID=1968823 RepID=UPI0026175625|nr:DUF2155 domain-containing protein [Henriciella sp.]